MTVHRPCSNEMVSHNDPSNISPLHPDKRNHYTKGDAMPHTDSQSLYEENLNTLLRYTLAYTMRK